MITIAIYEEDGAQRYVVHEHDDDGTAIEVTDNYQVLACPCEDGQGDGFFIRQLTGESGLLKRIKEYGT